MFNVGPLVAVPALRAGRPPFFATLARRLDVGPPVWAVPTLAARSALLAAATRVLDVGILLGVIAVSACRPSDLSVSLATVGSRSTEEEITWLYCHQRFVLVSQLDLG